MAGPTFKVEVKNDALRKAQEKLKVTRKSMSDLSTANSKVAIFLDQWVQKNFKSEGGKTSGGWAPFAPSTLHWMELYDPKRAPAKLLQRTGHLRASFLPFTSKNQAGIGSDLDYSKYHNEGTNKLPQRRMLPKYKEVIKDVRSIMMEHVKNSLRAFK